MADPRNPLELNREENRWRVTGRLPAAPWAEHAEVIVTIARHDRQNRLLLLDPGSLAATPETNLADQPRTDLTLDLELNDQRVRELPETLSPEWLFESGALLRCQEIAGALATVLDMTVQYAGERVQFGKPIARQQAIQQQLAVLATQAAVAAGAADMAVDAFHDPRRQSLIAAAKARCGEAAGQALAIAHQVHGAIGMTREYRLNLYSRRLWSWRDEFGGERYWQVRLGEQVLARGADGLWPFITELGSSTEGARQ
ncbi:acyl-CoA dehydrogenase [Alcanivorax xiamenensis]|uniref:Acyl-CoA dehydrogenase n=1 Tax=Alcanivorax xiamenensis TaxID=1177156 RepID=A0ABQ6YE49_9GAMM|nr:acyl-CoA dehydrogenase [Alcanivorax xiamenensis]